MLIFHSYVSLPEGTHLFVYLKLIQIVPYTPKNVGYGSHEISRLYLIVACCKCAYIYIHPPGLAHVDAWGRVGLWIKWTPGAALRDV